MSDNDLRTYYVQCGVCVYLICAYSKADALEQMRRHHPEFCREQMLNACDIKPAGGRGIIQFNY